MKTGEVTWKRVKDFEDYYSVSSLGEIYSHRKDAVLKPWVGTTGYKEISFCVGGVVSRHSVHRTVAITFLDNPQNLPQVNHLDGIKTNNTLSNLEWTDMRGNQLHSSHTLGKNRGASQHKARLTEVDVLEIKRLLREGVRLRDINKMFPVSYSTLFNIKNETAWAWLDCAER